MLLIFLRSKIEFEDTLRAMIGGKGDRPACDPLLAWKIVSIYTDVRLKPVEVSQALVRAV